MERVSWHGPSVLATITVRLGFRGWQQMTSEVCLRRRPERSSSTWIVEAL